MKTYYPWNANLANVLSLDYLGALLATLLFPFLLLPFFGLFQSSVGTGMVNVALGLFVAGVLGGRLTPRQRRWLFITGLLSLLGFVVLLFGARRLLSFAESSAFPHRVIYSRQTPYQRLTLTGNQDELRLYINRVIQFSSRDEYRYHESLALLPAAAHGRVRRVCILGGGEGLLAREVLRLPDVERVVIVDLDAEVFRLAREHPRVRALNERALFDPRVEPVTQDAGLFLRYDTARYDLILADLPDPATEGVARLYSTHFFRQVRERLAPGGYFATQAGSPYHTRKAYWCIYETAAAVFDHAGAYHAYVPSFGDWGFVLAGEEAPAGFRLPPDVRPLFLDLDEPDRYFYFPRDQDHPGKISINTLDRPTLLDYYLSEWRTWQRE